MDLLKFKQFIVLTYCGWWAQRRSHRHPGGDVALRMDHVGLDLS